jgi:hypothetical protein
MPTHTRVAQLVEQGASTATSAVNGAACQGSCGDAEGGVAVATAHPERSATGIEPSWSAVRGSPRVPLPIAPPHWEESHAPRKWAVGWHEPLLCATGPYLYRWYVETPWGSLRLHHWLHGDDHRGWHSHPWAFWTRLLRGEYTDLSPEGEVTLRAGDRAYRPAHHAHTVRLDNGPCWSLVVTGPLVRRWGFFDGKRWWRSNKWLEEREKFACQ